MARAKWVLVEDITRLTKKEWKEYVLQSYELVKQKLPKKLIKEFGLEK
jgi:predicted DNA-binding protein (MmcQ/YjbR family)